VEEGKGVEPSGLPPGPAFETGRVTRRTAFQVFSVWSRMQDSNPLNLFTRQVLWPVELIRLAFNVVRRAGIEPATVTL